MEEGDDRISFLPEEIKISILSRLEVQDAIRTSALARSWRRIWTLLPSLHLGVGQDLFGSDNDPSFVPSTWIERIHRLVSSLRGPLLVFKLVHNFHPDQSALIQSILDLLLQKGLLQELCLCCICCPDHLVALHLPSFQSVKALELWGCHIILPSAFHRLNCLTSLTLYDVQISNDHLHLLIHASNNLTTLKLALAPSNDPLSLNIYLPLLRYLEFQTFELFEEVSIISAPSLEKAYIDITYRNFVDNRSEKLSWVTLGLLTSVAMVSSLHLCVDAIKVLQLWERSSRQNNMVALMRELLLNKQDGIACLDKTLKNVTIDTAIWRDLTNLVPFITLVKFFLLNAKVLKLLKILHQCPFESSMIVELQEVKVTSSDAKLVFFQS